MKFTDLGRVRFGQRPEEENNAVNDTTLDDGCPAPIITKDCERNFAMLAKANEVLSVLPQDGETLHAIMTGRYEMMTLLTALILKVGAGSGSCQVALATLSFGDTNTVAICNHLDREEIAEITILCSDFFRSNNPSEYQFATKELVGERSQKLAAARNHCKVICLEFADGRKYVFEGSANLRSNSNWEQFTLNRSSQLHDWHRDWIKAKVAKHGCNSDE